MLSKAKRELDKLEAEAKGQHGEPDPNAIADLTINAAWSLWHVTDWIGNSNDPAVSHVVPAEIRKVDRERTDAFQKQLRSESKDLMICWALAVHFKHFEFEASSRARGILSVERVSAVAQNEPLSLSAVDAAPSLSPA
ncbi:MAG TPA: hypothetical protein VES94_03785, partial [Burkholderiales bacterium]|nr:hypothetical protein [Burkholderiales bacterium]